MRIIVGSDGGSFEYKEKILAYLKTKEDVEAIDAGVYDDGPSFYADTADKVGQMIVNKEGDRGILICGGGNGMLIAANKVPGIRATMAFDRTALMKSVTSSACQIIVFGSTIIPIEKAHELIDEWLKYDYPAELSAHVKKVIELEHKYNKR